MGTACPEGHDSAHSTFCDVCGTRLGPVPSPVSAIGKHRAPGRGGIGGAAACPNCGAAVSGPYCESCGVRLRARGPFAPLARPAEPDAADPSATESSPAKTSSGPPASLFPPISRPDSLFEPASGRPAAGADAGDPAAEEPPPAADPPTAPSRRLVAPPPPTTPIPSLRAVTWTVLVAADRVYFDRMKGAGVRYGPSVEFPAHTSERRIRLTGSQMRIGRRSATRDVQPEIDLAAQNGDPGISRLHAVLAAESGGTWSITDPGSANGTLLNGREIAVGQPVTLHEGDRINLGAWTVITVHRG